ncbi:signal peptidase I [Paenibacillus sp. GCM10027627]|uniref:signal peptidase I n=1 Tax=unclassified Paenibacillus TaxID=185978 RepID=UPI0036391CE4
MRMKFLFGWAKTCLVALLVVLLLNVFVFSFSRVEGHSMEPTLKGNERLYVNKLIYRFKAPKLGDIVVLKDPRPSMGEGKYLVKRIVGEPGDQIEISGAKLYRNGISVDEPYTDFPIEGMNFGPVTLLDDQYFVMGDNRREAASLDSRSFGAVEETILVGKADFAVWPLKRIRDL